jgi:hypothetical protein
VPGAALQALVDGRTELWEFVVADSALGLEGASMGCRWVGWATVNLSADGCAGRLKAGQTRRVRLGRGFAGPGRGSSAPAPRCVRSVPGSGRCGSSWPRRSQAGSHAPARSGRTLPCASCPARRARSQLAWWNPRRQAEEVARRVQWCAAVLTGMRMCRALVRRRFVVPAFGRGPVCRLALVQAVALRCRVGYINWFGDDGLRSGGGVSCDG